MLPCAYPPNEAPVYLCVSPKEAKRTEKTPGKLPGASLWKKPRRVRARRREENEIRFPRRHVRRGKHFPAEQCASWPPQADSECAHEAAAFPVEKGKAFFDGLAPGKLPGASHPFASGTTTLIWNHSSALWTVTAPPYFPAARRMDLIP